MENEEIYKNVLGKFVNIMYQPEPLKIVGRNLGTGELIADKIGGWRIDEDDELDITIDITPNSGKFWHVSIHDIINIEDYIMNVKIEVLEGGKKPEKGSDGAACYDVYAREIVKVNDHYYKVKLGIKTDIPKGYHAKLYSRSGITDTGWGLCNSTGIIDSDFLGEWQARFRPYAYADTWRFDEKTGEVIDSLPDFPYSVGDRVAQFHIRKDEEIEIEFVDKIEKETDRGAGGHGSTGLK